MTQNLSWKSNIFSSSQGVFACYDAKNVIVSYITSRLSKFYFRWTYFTPSYSIYLRLRLISFYRFRRRNGIPPTPGPRSNVFPPVSDQNSMHFSPTRALCYSLLNFLHPADMWWRVRIMKPVNMNLFLSSCWLLSVISKCSPETPRCPFFH